MNPRVLSVITLPGHRLALEFTNSERRVFDVRPYLTHGVFQQLTDETLFQQARVVGGTVVWPGDLDICPDTLFLESRPILECHAS